VIRDGSGQGVKQNLSLPGPSRRVRWQRRQACRWLDRRGVRSTAGKSHAKDRNQPYEPTPPPGRGATAECVIRISQACGRRRRACTTS
jgi:hypothetical protein